MNSIGRKTLFALLAVAIPPAVAMYFYSDGGAAALTVAAALPGVLVILALADLFARRLRRLESFVEAVSNGDPSKRPVARSDDELGSLSHSLTELAPQVEEMRDALRA